MSYSEAIRGNGFGRSSIEIPRMVNTDVYNNEELKKQYRISQTYVEGKEITFPAFTSNVDTKETIQSSEDCSDDVYRYNSSQSETDDEASPKGLVMKIDVERNDSPLYSSPSTTVHISNASTRPMASPSIPNDDSNIYESIERDESFYNAPDTNISSSVRDYSSSTPYTRRRRKGHMHR